MLRASAPVILSYTHHGRNDFDKVEARSEVNFSRKDRGGGFCGCLYMMKMYRGERAALCCADVHLVNSGERVKAQLLINH